MSVKTAYVTGGASGIGRAVVEMLASRGIRVAIADRNITEAKSVASSIKNAIAVEVDVSDWDSQLAGFTAALKEFGGRIEYVYGIAGISERRWIRNDPKSVDFAKPDLSTIDVDLNGVLYTAALAIQQMRRQEPDETGFRGKIAVVASICGFYCVPTMPIYTAAKHGVVGFVRSYGKHLSAEAITLNAICPDIVKTNLSTDAFYELPEVKDILVPMSLLLEAFERCLDTDISGETLEVQPRGGISHRSAPGPIDQDCAVSLELIRKRTARFHEPEST